jgi:peptide deformylase
VSDSNEVVADEVPDDVPPPRPASSYPGGPRADRGTPRPVTVIGTPVLHRVAREVTVFDDELADFVDDMFATMYVANGVGLAAPQVGDDRAVFVYDCPDDTGERFVGHVVNPVVVELSEETETQDEGCLSVPGPFFELERPFRATVRGIDRHGEPVEVTGTGFFGRCLQHETDHLNGRLYVDLLSGRNRRRAIREIEPQPWSAPLPDA